MIYFDDLGLNPVALRLGPLTIKWYALAYLFGILLGWWRLNILLNTQKDRLHLNSADPELLSRFVTWVTCGLILGGRLGYVFVYNRPFYMQHPLEIFKIYHGGMSFHGGLLGVVCATYLFSRTTSISFLTMLDLTSLVAPIGIFFGRIANFINGELWGRITYAFPYAVVFPNGGPYPRHPSQLYEACLEGLAVYCVMYISYKIWGLKHKGFQSGVFLCAYGLARIFCEQFREPDYTIGYLSWRMFGASLSSLTMGMVLSFPMLCLGLGLIYASCRSGASAKHS